MHLLLCNTMKVVKFATALRANVLLCIAKVAQG